MSSPPFRGRMKKILLGTLLCIGLTACAGPLSQFNFTAVELQRSPNFTHRNLEEGKAAILSAVAVDVYHEYRRVLADSFSKALRDTYPDIHQIPPQETLSLLNHADLADDHPDHRTQGVPADNLHGCGSQRSIRASA